MLAFVVPAFFSGLLGGLASLVAKLAMAGRETLELCEDLEYNLRKEKLIETLACPAVIAYVRLFCFFLIILFNSIMWTLFAKALQRSKTSVEPVVITTATNFFFSALFGFIFYKETISLMWCMGATLIIIGLITISRSGVDLIDNDDTEDIKLD